MDERHGLTRPLQVRKGHGFRRRVGWWVTLAPRAGNGHHYHASPIANDGFSLQASIRDIDNGISKEGVAIVGNGHGELVVYFD
jgi:hypothetical protein